MGHERVGPRAPETHVPCRNVQGTPKRMHGQYRLVAHARRCLLPQYDCGQGVFVAHPKKLLERAAQALLQIALVTVAIALCRDDPGAVVICLCDEILHHDRVGRRRLDACRE